MENTINDLYYKYTNEVGQALEEDRYFQYLYEMVQAGENTLLQNNRVLHKVVDEKWLSVVEDSLESIFNIIDKPRRFIATTEEVVPVALAKKITADRDAQKASSYRGTEKHNGKEYLLVDGYNVIHAW